MRLCSEEGFFSSITSARATLAIMRDNGVDEVLVPALSSGGDERGRCAGTESKSGW